MKKIDKLVLGAFLGPFVMTFLVVVFILLMQHMLKYFDDIIGKGLDADVIGQLLFYFAIFMTPVALPLAVLLSSLIAFGNLGEHFELTAIKSAGISLVRALVPIFIFVLMLTGVAFYANNNLVPKAALEAYSLLYDIKQKKPALDLREGAFYNGINDISIKVNKKFPDGVTLKDVVVYDHRKNDGNKEVTVADSGKMYTILNERYLKFELYDGYSYSEGANTQRDVDGRRKSDAQSLSRRRFDKSQVVFDLSSFQLERTDKKWFQGNRIMRNLKELDYDMDSISNEILGQKLNYYQYRPSYFAYLNNNDSLVMPEEVYRFKIRRDSLLAAEYTEKYNTVRADNATPKTNVQDDKKTLAENNKTLKSTTQEPTTVVTPNKSDSAKLQRRRPSPPRNKTREEQRKREIKTSKAIAQKPAAKRKTVKKQTVAKDTVVLTDSARVAKLDSVFTKLPEKQNYEGALAIARQVKTQILNANASIESHSKELITFDIQWHKILASSMACIAMFLIGAPLGAIIKKGGLGMPFLVSILFFIVYYVLTMQGEKLAKTNTISVGVGVWMADAVLFAVGLFFLRQARADARLFEADFYSVVFDKVKRWLAARKATKSAF